MGTVTVQKYTTVNPLSLVGEEAGICWGADIDDEEKNYKRGVDCVKSNHGRALEYPTIYLVISGYSSKVIREFYTHIIGNSRLQASTRYIDYSKQFDSVIPHSIANNEAAKKVWDEYMSNVAPTIQKLKELGVPTEDATNVLPLAYTTKIVVKMSLRSLINMTEMRLCNRAYWEFRELMKDILWALENYSSEWEDLIYDLRVFSPRCEKYGYCPETHGCGKYKSKQYLQIESKS